MPPSRQDHLINILDDPLFAASLRGVLGEESSAESAGIGTAGEREAIIIKTGRPALRVQDGAWEAPDLKELKEQLDERSEELERAVASVGRVELHGDREVFLGTAWVIAPRVAVTNRHVAEWFAYRKNGVSIMASDDSGKPLDVRVDFLEETGGGSREFAVGDVLYLAAYNEPDLAFLALDPLDDDDFPPPIPLESNANLRTLRKDAFIAAIGYPGKDEERHDAATIKAYFDGEYGIKRLSPGRVQSKAGGTIRHDCTTLKGSSGSVVISLKTGAAVGLHYSGAVGVSNYAVSASLLRRYLADYVIADESTTGQQLVGPLPDAPREGATAEELWERGGYNARFLGTMINLPQLPDTALKVTKPDSTQTRWLSYHHFSIAMHETRKMALVTAVNIDGTQEVKVKDSKSWRKDPRIKEHQWGNELYWKNPLDKGHMVRRIDPAWGAAAMAQAAEKDTFYYSNAAPQHSSAQRQGSSWADLENYILYSARSANFKATVFTGPVFRDSDVEYSRDNVPDFDPFTVKIPQSFWKLVVAERDGGGLLAAAFVFSQAELLADLESGYDGFTEFQTFQVRIRNLESMTGLTFPGILHQSDPLRSATNESTLALSQIIPIRGADDLVLG